MSVFVSKYFNMKMSSYKQEVANSLLKGKGWSRGSWYLEQQETPTTLDHIAMKLFLHQGQVVKLLILSCLKVSGEENKKLME
jgi:hypothetical protein